jgi:hypothetical protein
LAIHRAAVEGNEILFEGSALPRSARARVALRFERLFDENERLFEVLERPFMGAQLRALGLPNGSLVLRTTNEGRW